MAVQIWQKTPILPIFRLMHYSNYYADYTVQMKMFLYSPLDIPICYKDIWHFLEVEVFWFDLQFDHRFGCFGQCCLSSSAIILIIKREGEGKGEVWVP